MPTVTEAGYPALKYDGLVGLFGPRDLAADLRDRIAADVKAAAADPTIAARLLTTGQVVSPGRPAEFAASIDQQRAIVAAIAKEMGIKPAAVAVGRLRLPPLTNGVIPGRASARTRNPDGGARRRGRLDSGFAAARRPGMTA